MREIIPQVLNSDSLYHLTKSEISKIHGEAQSILTMLGFRDRDHVIQTVDRCGGRYSRREVQLKDLA